MLWEPQALLTLPNPPHQPIHGAGALLLTAAACQQSVANFGQAFVGVRTASPVFG